jgi:hypothetical protein
MMANLFTFQFVILDLFQDLFLILQMVSIILNLFQDLLMTRSRPGGLFIIFLYLPQMLNQVQHDWVRSARLGVFSMTVSRCHPEFISGSLNDS